MTAETHTITTPGAEITYDVRPGAGPALLLVGSPMDATGFGTLAGHFADRKVVTYDPRGIGRSKLTGGQSVTTPEEHADDLSRVIDAVGGGAVDVFASSGGAVNALALVAAHPDQVRTLVAHEPPIIPVLPDRENASAATKGIAELYQRAGMGPAMVKFILMTSHKGEVPPGWIDQPGPGPADFGLPAEDDGSRGDVLLEQNLISCTHYEPDFAALRAASTRIVIGVGEESADELAHRGGEGVAAGLGIEPVRFPSHHGGFLGGEYGQQGDPDNFAATLRKVLDEQA
ncbi:alpha/beta fold hydrolase [Paractinoplanes hotanensis]|uniref:Alpha/beta hydrolase n=1 Tax=Paractinoplanes hotanensis TaxID=2906497 RepID=A0ABT0XSE0_9ACTN|nr:alpha/beta hydrolase [Actinoplanes hotanensis]MCM4076158.1 alpha/beta hydrolase [Actinoplanes hotanensis]